MADLNRAYQWAINTCNAPNVGYNQDYRNQRTVKGITYYDCSSFIWYALLAGGFPVVPAYRSACGWNYSGNAITTAYEKAWLTALGFTQVSISGEWKAGDVLWRNGHTEMVYSGGTGRGRTMGAHSSRYKLTDQVSINTYESTASSWTSLYRYGQGGAEDTGISLFVISALCGNAWRESTINSGLTQIGGSGFGMFQWDGERKTALLNWLSQNGYSNTDPVGQLQYLQVENEWKGSFGGISSLDEFLYSTSTDIDMLTEAFMRCWERPGVPELEERIQHAHQCYDYISSHAQDTDITDWYITDFYLTESQTLNNAVMLYRQFATGGGGGTYTEPTKEMPLWMYIPRRRVIYGY